MPSTCQWSLSRSKTQLFKGNRVLVDISTGFCGLQPRSHIAVRAAVGLQIEAYFSPATTAVTQSATWWCAASEASILLQNHTEHKVGAEQRLVLPEGARRCSQPAAGGLRLRQRRQRRHGRRRSWITKKYEKALQLHNYARQTLQTLTACLTRRFSWLCLPGSRKTARGVKVALPAAMRFEAY